MNYDQDKQGTRMRSALKVLILLLVVAVLLGSCAPGGNAMESGSAIAADPERAEDPAGFWLGLWHGIIAPVTFVVSLFTDTVNIYEIYNTGGWYNFGLIIGLSMSLGGSGSGAGHASAEAKRRKSEQNRYYDDGSEAREL